MRFNLTACLLQINNLGVISSFSNPTDLQAACHVFILICCLYWFPWDWATQYWSWRGWFMFLIPPSPPPHFLGATPFPTHWQEGRWLRKPNGVLPQGVKPGTDGEGRTGMNWSGLVCTECQTIWVLLLDVCFLWDSLSKPVENMPSNCGAKSSEPTAHLGKPRS